jgi:hypothetical protein
MEHGKKEQIRGLILRVGVHVCNAAIIFFLIASLFAFFCSLAGPLTPHLFTGLRFPLAGLTGIAVDDENIYTISQGYGRLQVFDKRGNFVRGWFGPFSKGTFWINIYKNNNLSVVISDGEEYIYSIDGKLLKKSGHPDEYIRQDKNETYDSEGNLYISIDSFRSKVIKFSPSGKVDSVVSDPIWLSLIKVPISLIILIALIFPRGYFQKCLSYSKTNLKQ